MPTLPDDLNSNGRTITAWRLRGRVNFGNAAPILYSPTRGWSGYPTIDTVTSIPPGKQHRRRREWEREAI